MRPFDCVCVCVCLCILVLKNASVGHESSPNGLGILYMRKIKNIYRVFQCPLDHLEVEWQHRNRPVSLVLNYQWLLVSSMRAVHLDAVCHFHGNIVMPPVFDAYNGCAKEETKQKKKQKNTQYPIIRMQIKNSKFKIKIRTT